MEKTDTRLQAGQTDGATPASAFTPTAAMIAAAETAFMAMLLVETVKPIVNGYQKKLLEEGQWRIALYTDRLGTDVITDHSRAYLMSEEDFTVYDARCKAERDKAGLQQENSEQCPLLVAESLLMKAEHSLIEAMRGPAKVTAHALISAGGDKYRCFVDLSLRLLAPYCKNKLQPIAGDARAHGPVLAITQSR